jgi:hypothetical protein
MADDRQIDPRYWIRPNEALVNDFRKAKNDIIEEKSPGNSGKETRSIAHPLDYYFKRDWITFEQHAAGVDFGQLCWLAFCRTGHAQWKYTINGGGFLVPGMITSALIEFAHAHDSIRGNKEKKVAVRVCCYETPAGERTGMRRLKSSLDDLYEHFRSRRSSHG